MAQHYFDVTRAGDPHALPDLETFYGWVPHEDGECPNTGDSCSAASCRAELLGWYWQACMPGCLPDGEPCGPFETEVAALEDAREGVEPEGDDCRVCGRPLHAQSADNRGGKVCECKPVQSHDSL